jgi:hypothetical protein
MPDTRAPDQCVVGADVQAKMKSDTAVEGMSTTSLAKLPERVTMTGLTEHQRADHHQRQTGFGNGRAVVLLYFALVEPLLNGAGDGSDESDADEDGEEGESNLPVSEAVPAGKGFQVSGDSIKD